jgi:hypothetical protein
MMFWTLFVLSRHTTSWYLVTEVLSRGARPDLVRGLGRGGPFWRGLFRRWTRPGLLENLFREVAGMDGGPPARLND